MQIIDAVWEKRNLGVESTELRIEQEDVANLSEVLKKIKTQYQVLKVASNIDVDVQLIQEAGFVYAEDLIEVHHDLHVPARSPMHQRLYDATSFKRMDDSDYAELLREVEDGMFSTDRIAKDPHFGVKLSAKRYMGWLADLKKSGALFYVIKYKDKSSGFVVLTKGADGKEYTSVLGGAYKEFRNKGLGLIQKEQEIVKSLGGKKLRTVVSSNNSGQLKALVINGYVPVMIEHVFVKHVS